MNNEIESNFIWKGTVFWEKEIKKAGVLDKLDFFNDVITEKSAPHRDSGYKTPILTDVILDGKKTDIYHSDHDDGPKLSRIFLHIKE